jgi:hypothetical protein
MTPPLSIQRKIPWPGFDVYPVVAKAIAAGRLERRPCCVCGCSDGKAHHADYDKALDVVFLCSRHHLQFHRRLTKEFRQQNPQPDLFHVASRQKPNGPQNKARGSPPKKRGPASANSQAQNDGVLTQVYRAGRVAQVAPPAFVQRINERRTTYAS